MIATQAFEKLVQFTRSSVADEFFERNTPLVFEKEDGRASLEVRCVSTEDLSVFRKHTESFDQAVIKGDNSTLAAAPAPIASEDIRNAEWLQIIDLDLSRLRPFILATRSSFRVFYIRQRNSFTRLRITKPVFQELVEGCAIFPRFNEYVLDYRWKKRESEVGPPPIRFRLLSDDGYECAYGIRHVEFTNREGKPPWSLRQFAVYHKYIPEAGRQCSTWVLVGASQRTESCLSQYLHEAGDLNMAHPFELHVVFLDVAIASWRPYLAYLLEESAQVSDIAVATMVGKEDDPEGFVTVELDDYQRLKDIEDRISDVVLCLDSTLDTLQTFVSMHKSYFTPASTEPRTKFESVKRPKVDTLLYVLKEKQREVAYARKKAEAMLAKAQNTRALISSLLERQTGHNLDQQMSALQNLEKEAYEENAIMRQLAEKSSRDSASVRILTIITLIYLPCTVVSSFYSTQFVDQKERPDGAHDVEYMDNAWLFFAVSIPLTLFTIMVWYTWSHFGSILSLFVLKRDSQTASFTERIKMMSLLKKRRELPR